MIKKTFKLVRVIFLFIMAIGILYFINVNSPDTNRAGQQIPE